MDYEEGQPTSKAPEVLDYTGRSPEALGVLDRHLQKRSTPAGLDNEELGGLSDPGQWDCPRAQNILE